MNEPIGILNDFLEKFELNLKDGYLEENLLKSIEMNKIKIFTILSQGGGNVPVNNSTSSINARFIKVFVSKVWNLCRMLNYTRNIKDIDNNYFLLRLKDFLCDLYMLIFSTFSEITLHDVFNLIQLVTEVGSQWMKLELKMSTEGWMKKVDHIMKYLISKINDVENIVHLERKFYINFMDYLNFYIENFILNPENNETFNWESKFEDVLKIILLIKKLKFLENETSTRNLIVNLLFFFKKLNNETHNPENVVVLCEGLDSVKYKLLLPFDLLSDFYKFYIQLLINLNSFNIAEKVLKRLFEFISANSREEIECYLLSLEIAANNKTFSDEENKIKDIIEILFEHKEFNFEYLEDLAILSTNLSFFDLFLEIFIHKLKITKTLKLSTVNNNLIFNYDNLKSYKHLSFIFLFSFFRSNYFLSNQYINLTNHVQNFFEIMKIISECLLENFSNSQYDEEQNQVIPLILKNLVILYVKIEKQNENFSSYFLIEIIKKINNEKEFVNLSLEIYIEKKDYIKLKNIVKELEEKEGRKNSLFFYAQIILLIKEGNKWNSHNQINKVCLNLNSAEDFSIIFYLKIFNFIFDLNLQDFSIISTVLNNFSLKFFEFFQAKQFDKINYGLDKSNLNKSSSSFFDIIAEVLGFYSKLGNFSQQIVQFIDLLTLIGDHVEFEIMSENSHLLTNTLTIVLEIVNILLNYKNKNNLGNNSSTNRYCDDYPEFVLIFCCKLLNFLFSNFLIFSYEFFNVEESLLFDQLKNFMDILELYKSLSIFYFSYQFHYLSNNCEEGNNCNPEEDDIQSKSPTYFFQKVAETQEKYQKTFMDCINLLKSKFTSHQEMLVFIEEKSGFLQNSTKSIEQILKLQILGKIESEEFLEDYVMNLYDSVDTGNKKFLYVINSILYQNGNKNISFKFIKKLLTSILNLFQDLVPKSYTLEDIFLLYKDYVNLSDSNHTKISSIREFANFILKIAGKIDDFLLAENIEWILFKLFNILENTEEKLNKSDKEFAVLKQIFDDMSSINLRNKSYILSNLFDIILKKILI